MTVRLMFDLGLIIVSQVWLLFNCVRLGVNLKFVPHLQNINPDSDKSEKCWKKFLIAKHFFESSFALRVFVYLTHIESRLSFFHAPLLKFSSQNSATRWGQYPKGPKIKSAFKVHACVGTFSLANQDGGKRFWFKEVFDSKALLWIIIRYKILFT